MLDLPPAEVHVWWAPPRFDPSIARMLDSVEHERLENYRRDEDKARFLTGTMLVRTIYADDLEIDPAAVKLDRTCPDCGRPHGKVRLAQPDSDIEVSVSHSGAWVLVAACRAHPIGVDVEKVDPGLDHLALASIALTKSETAALAMSADRADSFTTTWARKEAVVKALGEGLRTPLNGFSVAAHGVQEWPERPDLMGRVHLVDLDADGDHRAAVAVLDEKPAKVVRR